jgi:hypothetical protein
MALVADYGTSSGEESAGEDEETVLEPSVSVGAKVLKESGAPSSSTQSNSTLLPVSIIKLPAPAAGIVAQSRSHTAHINFFEDDDDEDEDEGDDADDGSILAKILPKPKGPNLQGPSTDSAEPFEEIGPIPPKKVYGDEEEVQASGPSTSSSTSKFHNIKSTRTLGKIQITAPSLKDVS